MKHTNKKGFTIVELVIVIAVIAILAAVLIPTFSNLIKKANQSSDIQAARQMNTVLAAEQGIGDNIDKVIDVLVENGYSANGLTPVTANHKFFYVVDYERVVLFDEKKGEVVFPKEITIGESKKYDLGESVTYIDVVANDAATLQNAMSAGSQDISLTTGMAITDDVIIPANANVTLNLGGNALTSEEKTGGDSMYIKVTAGASLTIVNGTVDCRGIMITGNFTIAENANVVITNSDSTGGSPLRLKAGATVVINGGTYKALGGDLADKLGDDAYWAEETGNRGAEPNVVNNDGGNIVINGGTFETTQSFQYPVCTLGNGTTEINGGTFVGYRGCVDATKGSITINGGTFIGGNVMGGHVLYAATAGKIVVTGGTFTGTLSGTAETLVIKGGTFSVDPSAYVDAAAYNVTANSDGTWTVTAK